VIEKQYPSVRRMLCSPSHISNDAYLSRCDGQRYHRAMGRYKSANRMKFGLPLATPESKQVFHCDAREGVWPSDSQLHSSGA
jgi:hypothetical protein